MALNGWQRLFVLVSLPILAAGIVGAVMYPDEALTMLASAAVWPIALYALGFGIAWVRRGFKT